MGADGSSQPKVRGVALQSFPLANSTFPDNQAGISRFVAFLCCPFVPSVHLLSCDLHVCVCVCVRVPSSIKSNISGQVIINSQDNFSNSPYSIIRSHQGHRTGRRMLLMLHTSLADMVAR